MRFPFRPWGSRSVATRPPGPAAPDRPRTRRLWPSRSGASSPQSIGCGFWRRRIAAHSPARSGRLLRGEGLYSSHLTAWREARRKGSLRELAAKKRGAKPAERNPPDAVRARIEAQVARLEHELHTAHTILDVQGKVAGLRGIEPRTTELALDRGPTACGAGRRGAGLPPSTGRVTGDLLPSSEVQLPGHRHPPSNARPGPV